MKNKNALPWHVVEEKISKEIDWLKQVLDIREKELSYDACECNYRKVALLIVKGVVKAKEYNTINGKDLWDGLTQTTRPLKKYRHGEEWHRKMMAAIELYFKKQKYKVVLEPNLDWGRADLGVYKKGKKNLFVEIGTLSSIRKLWLNLQTMHDTIILCVPSEHKIIEFETFAESTHRRFHPLKK